MILFIYLFIYLYLLIIDNFYLDIKLLWYNTKRGEQTFASLNY